jgi:GNAT superfamily N-acetyltransferase
MKMNSPTDYPLKADRDVVASWIEGWALSRGTAAPVQVYDGFRVDVGLPDQKARYLFVEASSAVERMSREIGEPNVFIKVCAPPEVVEPLLASGWSIAPVDFMMTADDLYRSDARHPDHYQYKLEPVPRGYVVSAHAENGEVGASGRVFLVGSTAVFDQIATHPDHRRRGLGRSIMSELGAAAFRDGATKGSLVATPDGRALYSTLGWRLYSPITTAVRVAAQFPRARPPARRATPVPRQ